MASIAPVAQTPTPASQVAAASAPKSSDDDGFGFDDFLDIINPLQHIPVVSTVYRKLTGDHIETPAKLMGDTLFGGITGFFCSLGDIIFTQLTGKSVGDTVYDALLGDDQQSAALQVAAHDSSAPEYIGADPVTAQKAMAAYRRGGMLAEAY